MKGSVLGGGESHRQLKLVNTTDLPFTLPLKTRRVKDLQVAAEMKGRKFDLPA